MSGAWRTAQSVARRAAHVHGSAGAFAPDRPLRLVLVGGWARLEKWARGGPLASPAVAAAGFGSTLCVFRLTAALGAAALQAVTRIVKAGRTPFLAHEAFFELVS